MKYVLVSVREVLLSVAAAVAALTAAEQDYDGAGQSLGL